MTSLRARPRIAAWVFVLAVILLGTWLAIAGLRFLARPVPAGLDTARGTIVAVRGSTLFEARVSEPGGHTQLLWFHISPGSPISVAHLSRHQREGAPTVIDYAADAHGALWAWVAD